MNNKNKINNQNIDLDLEYLPLIYDDIVNLNVYPEKDYINVDNPLHYY